MAKDTFSKSKVTLVKGDISSSEKEEEVKPLTEVAEFKPRSIPKPNEPKTYRVLEKKEVSIHGQRVKLFVGKLISEASHGPGVIETLRKAKVKLEEV